MLGFETRPFRTGGGENTPDGGGADADAGITISMTLNPKQSSTPHPYIFEHSQLTLRRPSTLQPPPVRRLVHAARPPPPSSLSSSGLPPHRLQAHGVKCVLIVTRSLHSVVLSK